MLGTVHRAGLANLCKLMKELFKQPHFWPHSNGRGQSISSGVEDSEPCEFTIGWLHKFKSSHTIHFLETIGEKLSADKEAST